MRWAIPASVSLHLGLLAAAWLAMQWKPEELSLSEAAVSIDIIAMEDAVTEPSETISEATANLVSAGTASLASEPEEAEAIAPVEVAAVQPVAPPAAVAVTETVQPAETEDLVSAEVLTALSEVEHPIAAPALQVTDEAAPLVAETVAPSEAEILERLDEAAKLTEFQPPPEAQEITTASINPVTPAEPVTVANLAPALEPVEEIAAPPPVPKPRIVRKPVEAEQKPAEDKKPVEKKKAEKPTEKPVEKKQPKKVASLGNGGEAEADSAAAKASGGTAGKVTAAGQGALDAYQGKVRSRLLKAVRAPKGGKGLEARVMFTLDAKGRVISAKLSKSSGDAKLDQAAFAAVERAAPYPPIPEGAGKSTWSFTIPIAIN